MDALLVISVDLHCRLLHVYHKPNTYLCTHKQSDLKVIINNLSSRPRWQDIICCSRYMFRASTFCSRATYVYSICSRPWGCGHGTAWTSTVMLTTHSCICTVVKKTRWPPRTAGLWVL